VHEITKTASSETILDGAHGQFMASHGKQRLKLKIRVKLLVIRKLGLVHRIA
jgi:hypothetical protein